MVKNNHFVMKKSKLIDLLSSFSSGEMERFAEFVASPYYNNNEDLVRFLALLRPFHPEFPVEKVKKEKIFGKLFPGRPYDKKELAYNMNYLLKLGEQFLTLQRYESKPYLNAFHLLEEFSRRKLEKHYNFLYNKTSKALQGNGAGESKQNHQLFYQTYQLAEIASNHFISQSVRKFDPNLQHSADALDEFYFFQKLKYCCEMLNRQAIISGTYEIRFIEEIENYLLEQRSNSPLITIFLRIYQCLADPTNEDSYAALLKLIKAHAPYVDHALLREIYLYAINYALRKIRSSAEYGEIVLDLYVEGIENRALFEGEYLSHWTYSNTVKVALRYRSFEWVKNFIDENKAFLSPQFREDAYHFNLAEIYYRNKDLDRVFDHLNQVHFSDVHYHYGSRVILIKTFYEQDELEPLLSQLASFSIALRRNKKISAHLKASYLNFCNVLNQILRRNRKKRDQVAENIEKVNPVAERTWLKRVWEQEQKYY